VIELKRKGEEKRARRKMTRPEPTIIGNCEGWNFIVGKNAKEKSPNNPTEESLRANNGIFINSLSTIYLEIR